MFAVPACRPTEKSTVLHREDGRYALATSGGRGILASEIVLEASLHLAVYTCPVVSRAYRPRSGLRRQTGQVLRS